LLGVFGAIRFLSCAGAGAAPTEGGTSRRDSGPGGDRAMPASACCLAMNCLAMSCLAMSCLATGAEALRRLCGGVPIAGRPMLGRAAHAQESRLCSSEPRMLARAACARQHCLHHGGAAHAGLRPLPPVVGGVSPGACSQGPVPRGISSHRRLSPDGRLSPAPAPGGARGQGGPGSLPPPRLDGEFRRRDWGSRRRDDTPGCLRCTKRTSTTSPSSCMLRCILLLHFFSFRTPADGARIHGGRRASFSTGPGGRTAAADVRQGAPRTARPGAVAAACEAVSGTCERQSSPAS
jgi:hypothetical protein